MHQYDGAANYTVQYTANIKKIRETPLLANIIAPIPLVELSQLHPQSTYRIEMK
jgi:hypothetical protein